MHNFIFLQAEGGGFPAEYILFGGMIVVFYLFFIRPQQKKQKNQKKFLEEVKKGVTVVTVGGIHGKITSIDDTTVILEIDKGARIKIEKTSISMDATKKISNSN